MAGVRLRAFAEGFSFLEVPRWHEGQLRVADMCSGRVLAFAADGSVRVTVDVPGTPTGLGWLPDGRLLVVLRERRLLRLGPGGLVEVCDLAEIGPGVPNEFSADAGGLVYAGVFGLASGGLVRVAPDGTICRVAGDLLLPNGQAITPDGQLLIVAESAGQRLTAFALTPDGRSSSCWTSARSSPGLTRSVYPAKTSASRHDCATCPRSARYSRLNRWSSCIDAASTAAVPSAWGPAGSASSVPNPVMVARQGRSRPSAGSSGSHQVLIDNDRVRVLEVSIGPGRREPEHTHRRSSVMIVDGPGRIRYYAQGALEFEAPPGAPATGIKVSWAAPEGPHSVENIDDRPYHAIRVELRVTGLTSSGVVIVEFPTMKRLRSWYDSGDYAEALAVRQTALTRRLLFVDGVGDQQ